jgi:hypothetical protein
MYFGTLSAPAADHGTGTYTSSVTVTLSALSGATIRYTTNGSTPDSGSPAYTAPLVFDTTITLKAKAFHSDYTASSVASFTITLESAAPTFNPTAGTYVAGQVVTVSAATSGASIHYTINGSDPTISDPVIASGATLIVGNYTLKARAFKTGTSTSSTTSAAYAVTGDVTPPALAAGSYYSLAIRNDGTAWGWGINSVGQTGDGTTTSPRLLPRIATGLTGIVAIDGGEGHTHALTSDGTLLGFGGNSNGRLGDGTTTARLLPTAITGITGLVAVRDAYDHTIALKGDASVYAWGNNSYGQLGDGTTTQRTSPTAITGGTSVTAIAALQDFSVALKQDGTILSWGRNTMGQLGNGTTTNSSSPVSVSSITTATAIAAGQFHVLALLSNGRVMAWGHRDPTYDAGRRRGS